MGAATSRDKVPLIRGFFVVMAIALAVITAAQVWQGRPLGDVLPEALLWSMISSGIFTATRIYRWRKGQYCAVCGDVPASALPRRDARG